MQITKIMSTVNTNHTQNIQKTAPKSLAFKSLDTFDSSDLDMPACGFDETLMSIPAGFLFRGKNWTGRINKQEALIEQRPKKGDKTSETLRGSIGNKKVELTAVKRENYTLYKGYFGDKYVKARLNAPVDNQCSIITIIDGDKKQISMPDSLIEEHLQDSDFLTLITSINGYKINAKDGQFTKLTPSCERAIEIKVRQIEESMGPFSHLSHRQLM